MLHRKIIAPLFLFVIVVTALCLAHTRNSIFFYNKGEPYYEFTNFYEGKPIQIDGKLWPTSEHYFQAMKFIDENEWIQEEIRAALTPRKAFELANAKDGTYRDYIRADWVKVKDAIMYKAVYAKFSQDQNLKHLLLSTGSKKLVEASPLDSYWGYGPDKRGKNMLGKILMRARKALKHDR